MAILLKNSEVQKQLLAVATVWMMAMGYGQDLITNGSFELPGLPGNEPARYLTNGSTLITGWTVIDDNIGERPFYAKSPLNDAVFQGNYGVILSQGSGISTTFTAEVGTLYELSFWLRPGDCAQCMTPSPLRVKLGTNTFSVPLASGWNRAAIQFFATAATDTLEFFNPSSPSDAKRFGLDDVTITKLPGALLAAKLYPGIVIEGTVGARYRIEATPNLGLSSWQIITNFVLPASPYLYLDIDPTRPFDYPPKRIYRAVRVP